ncbi:MAG: hypothetical protein K0Q72_3549 [Armatimonadetes bacterium]|jgi:hypothetical protein|nr:hypothetical protein [Armatimonadota bacterium]
MAVFNQVVPKGRRATQKPGARVVVRGVQGEETRPSSAVRAAMEAAGERATNQARASLFAAGVYPVISRDGELLEELPDGSTRPYIDLAP